MATKKEALIQCAIDELKSSPQMTPMMGPVELRFIETILPIVLPIFLEWFMNCFKVSAAKKAAQIDNEQRRLALVRRGRRQERKLHKRAEKLAKKPEVVEANGGVPLTDDQEDALYERVVQWSFENRDAVARAAATRG
jgi:hypothetical protein